MARLINLWNFHVLSMFVEKPKEHFLWTVKDFRKAKKWAKTQKDPENPKRSLWDRCYSGRLDSAEVLHNINQFI